MQWPDQIPQPPQPELPIDDPRGYWEDDDRGDPDDWDGDFDYWEGR